MNPFNRKVPLAGRRYVECPGCGTADHRFVGVFSAMNQRGYEENCRACGASLHGDVARDFPPRSGKHRDNVQLFYVSNALVWMPIWGIPFAFFLLIALDGAWRVYGIFAGLVWGFGWGLYRARRAHRRGEMFVRKRRDTPIDVG